MIGFEKKIIDASRGKLTITPTRVTLKVPRTATVAGEMEMREIAEKMGNHIQPLIDRTLRGDFCENAIVVRGNDKTHPIVFSYIYADREIIRGPKEDNHDKEE